MVEYWNAVKLPFSDWKKFGLGLVMYLIPFVNIITGFFASGYTLYCAKGAMKKDMKLPEWTNWGDLFAKGILLLVLGVVYMIPALIIGLIFGATTLMSAFSLGAVNPLGMLGALGGGMIVAVILAILAWYVIPVAAMMFIDTNKFSEAFKFKAVFAKAFTGKYLVSWLFVLVFVIVIQFILFWLNRATAITIILPLIFSAAAAFWIGVTAMTIFGETYKTLK